MLEELARTNDEKDAKATESGVGGKLHSSRRKKQTGNMQTINAYGEERLAPELGKPPLCFEPRKREIRRVRMGCSHGYLLLANWTQIDTFEAENLTRSSTESGKQI